MFALTISKVWASPESRSQRVDIVQLDRPDRVRVEATTRRNGAKVISGDCAMPYSAEHDGRVDDRGGRMP